MIRLNPRRSTRELSAHVLWLITLALLANPIKVASLELDNISQAYEFLPKSEAPCYFRRVALLIDKPAYKIGETVHIAAYYYHLLDKKPLTECTDNQSANIEITDVDDKYIQNATEDFDTGSTTITDY